MASLKYIAGIDLMTVTLASNYTAADGVMHLTSGHGARLPTAGDFWLRTTSGTYRCFKVTARSTDDITVTPAQDGTSDGNLSAGAELKWVLGATALDQFRGDVCGTGTDAAKSAEKAGRIWLPNDGYYLRCDTGAAWNNWGPTFPLVEPINADYSDLNSPTVVTTNGGIYISTAAATDAIRGRVKAVPGSTPYTKTVAFIPRFINENYHGAGLCITNGTKVITFGYVTDPTTAGQLASSDWNSVTSYNASNFGLQVVPSPPVFLRYYDNGTTRYFYWSVDGVNWEELFSEGRTTFLTATYIGMYVHVNNASRGTGGTFLHWVDA